jgi:hypothetical protein
MPSRINHIKIVCPQPAVVDAFLREVCDVPEGWPLGELEKLPEGAPLGPGGTLPDDIQAERRQATGRGGFITGDANSRQFQIIESEVNDYVWAICISTRYIEDVHARAVERGVPCTSIQLTDWNPKDNIRFFFCEVGKLMFEIIRVEPKDFNG